MSLAQTIECPTCKFAVHPGFTGLVPAGRGLLVRVCLKCLNDFIELTKAENERRRAAAAAQEVPQP